MSTRLENLSDLM